MAEWTHCNACYRRPDNAVKFGLTNCGHVFCANCLPAGGGAPVVCKVCKHKASVVEINRQLSKNLQPFFQEPKALLQKNLKRLNQLMDFQGGHRARLFNNLKTKTAKIDKMVAYFQCEMKQKAELEKENRSLKEMAERLKSQVADYQRREERRSAARTPGRTRSRHRHRSPVNQYAARSPFDKELLMSFDSSTPAVDGGKGASMSAARLHSPVTSAGGADDQTLTTPMMLGFGASSAAAAASLGGSAKRRRDFLAAATADDDDERVAPDYSFGL